MTTRQVELIRKKEFTVAVLDPEYETFVKHIAAFSVDLKNDVHLSKKAQIIHLKANKAPIKISSKYADFADVFSRKLTVELLEHTEINDHAIELVDN